MIGSCNVCNWLPMGARARQSADMLEISVHTVNAYMVTAADKLDSVNRIQAIAKALRLGLIG